jgi:hypothetical protein
MERLILFLLILFENNIRLILYRYRSKHNLGHTQVFWQFCLFNRFDDYVLYGCFSVGFILLKKVCMIPYYYIVKKIIFYL